MVVHQVGPTVVLLGGADYDGLDVGWRCERAQGSTRMPRKPESKMIRDMQYERKQRVDAAPHRQVHLLVFGRPAQGARYGWFLDGPRKKLMILLG